MCNLDGSENLIAAIFLILVSPSVKAFEGQLVNVIAKSDKM